MQEKKWHASEQHSLQPDGTQIAEYQLSGVEEINRWLLSFGRHAEVLEPPGLRAQMQEEVRALGEVYARAGQVGDRRPYDRPARSEKNGSPGGKALAKKTRKRSGDATGEGAVRVRAILLTSRRRTGTLGAKRELRS